MLKQNSWLGFEEKELEEKVLSDYSTEEVRSHLKYLTRLTRLAGSDDERNGQIGVA